MAGWRRVRTFLAPTGCELLSQSSSYYPNPPKIAVDIVVGDLTGREQEFTLQKNGFCLAKQETHFMKTTEDIQNTDKIKNEYYPEMAAWLKEL